MYPEAVCMIFTGHLKAPTPIRPTPIKPKAKKPTNLLTVPKPQVSPVFPFRQNIFYLLDYIIRRSEKWMFKDVFSRLPDKMKYIC